MTRLGLNGSPRVPLLTTSYFAREIVGNLLEMEPRTWRKPRRLDGKQHAQMLANFRSRWSDFDWTKLLNEQPEQQQQQQQS